MDSSIDDACAVCPRPGKLCPGCNDIYYCCRSHQKDDWPIHKLVCKKIAVYEKRPYPGKILTLYLPVNRSEPEFRRLSFDRKWPLWNGNSLFLPRKLQLDGCSSTCPCKQNTHDSRSTFSSAHNPLCRHIYISAPEQNDNPFMPDKDLDVNRCIETLTGDTSWTGPVIAFAKNPKEESIDMRTPALRKTLSAFRDVVGVRINCDGVVKAQHAPRFEAVTINSYDLRGAIDHYLWTHPRDQRNASFFTQYTGIVLQDKRESYKGNPSHSGLDTRNSISRLMSIPCEISKQSFGYYSRPSDTGNVIVVREDRETLGVEYMEILCDWVSTNLLPLFRQARSECALIERREPSVTARTSQKRTVGQNVLRCITKQNLIAYSRGRLRDVDTKNRGDEKMGRHHRE
jgi:hypothetical protein